MTSCGPWLDDAVAKSRTRHAQIAAARESPCDSSSGSSAGVST